jgi:hypothetical protein
MDASAFLGYRGARIDIHFNNKTFTCAKSLRANCHWLVPDAQLIVCPLQMKSKPDTIASTSWAGSDHNPAGKVNDKDG